MSCRPCSALDLKPAAWWRLDEFSGPHAIDASGHRHDAIYEREIVLSG
jgi:hypothetical protein